MNKFTSTVVALFLSVAAMAQGYRISGTVTSAADGQPMPGVSISEQGTSNGVSTNIDGTYSITVRSAGEATLVYSFLGYRNETRQVNKSMTVVHVALAEESESIDEVVVVGYGVQKRSDLTGSIASISAEKLKTSAITNADQMLQGRVAGVQVTQNSGAPGGAASIRVRGASSITSSNEPLYVIDGIPFSGDGNDIGGFDWAGGTGGQTKVNPLSTIAPSDIVSMDVLKDASATAIYGSAGANGVVIITTRRGEKGQMKLNYDGYAAWQQQGRKIEMMNLPQYARFQKEIADMYPSIQVDDSLLDPTILGDGTDWQDEIFRTAFTHSHSVSFSGGTDKFQFAGSGGYMSQDGTIYGSGFERYNARFNGDGQINKWLRAGGSLAFTHTDETITRQDGNDGVIMGALSMMPSVPVYDFNGEFATPTSTYASSAYNPLWQAESQTNTLSRNRTMGNFYLQIDPVEGLNIRTEFGFDLSDNKNDSFMPRYDFGQATSKINQIMSRRDHSIFWIWKAYATYNKTFAEKHNISVMAGFEAQKSAWDGTTLIKQGLSSDDITVITSDGVFGSNSGWKDKTTKVSAFARLNYNYDERYLLTATFRADASSKFGPSNKWGFFPSAAFAWRISNEQFLRDSEVLSNLKLRLGYGLVGNDNIGTYKYGSTMQTMLSPFPGANSSYIPSNISNANLKWEASEQYNLGVDFGMINNRISLSVDLYQKDTKDLLLQVSTPSYMGNKIQAPYANIGKVRNRGVDIALNLVPVERPDFTWNSNIIVSVNRNEVLGLNDDSQVIYNGVDVYFGAAFKTASLIKVGQPIGVFYGYTTEGYFQNEEDVLQHAVQVEDGNNPGKNLYNKMNGVYTGDIKFKDLDDSGSIDAADQSIIGDPNPDFTYGWTNTFNYKNWELTVGLNGVVGGDILNIARYRVESLSSSWDNQSARMADRALIATDELGNDYLANPATAVAPRFAPNDINGNRRMSDRWLEDGTYLRIQNVTLAYNFPRRWLQKASIQSLKLYVTLQNLYTWTNYSGYDPEIGAFNQSAGMQNYDMGRYPTPRMYIVGLNIGF